MEIAKVDNKGIIDEITRAECEGYLWDLNNGNLIKVPVKLRSHSLHRKEFHFDFDKKFSTVITNFIKGSGLVKVFIPRFKVAFEVDLIKLEEKNLRTSFPKKFKRFERRETPRFEPLFPIQFLIGGKKFECFDISEGGFSVVLGTLELPYLKWKEGQKSKGQIKFPLRNIDVEATIVAVHKIPPYKNDRFMYGAYRISFMFSEKYASMKPEIEKLMVSIGKLMSDLS